MTFYDIAHESWLSISGNKMRSFLTVLGIVIGIMAVVIMVAVGETVQQSITDQFSSLGTNTIMIRAGAAQSAGIRSGNRMTLTLDDAEFVGKLSDVAAVSPVENSNAQVVYGNKNWSTSMVGVYPGYATVQNIEMEYGSFFDMKYYNPICYLRIDGEEVGINTPGKDDTINRKYYQYASIKLRNGKPKLFIPDSSRFAEQSRPDSNIMTAGPMLLWHGERSPQRDDRTFVTYRHNRTALGTKADGTVIILTADGRFRNVAEGLSLPELTSIMKWLGCVNAINLDGGGSTTMFVKGRPNGGLLTHPSDNGKFDYQGERPVSNAILIL